MQDYKNRVEAILFTTGRFMDIEELSRLTGVASMGLLKEIAAELKKDYETRPGALALLEEGGRYKLNIKKEYAYLSSKLLTDCELDKPTQETLAVIAYKNPALQSDIIKVRGNKAYDHVKFLKENDFVSSEKHGRSRLLKLAPKFFEYFDVVEESLKSQLGQVEQKVVSDHQCTLQQGSTQSETTSQGSDQKEAEGADPKDEKIN